MATYLNVITSKLNLMLAKIGIISAADKAEFKSYGTYDAYGGSNAIIRPGSAFEDSMNILSP